MHPTQAVEIFGNISTAFGTLAILLTSTDKNSSGDEIANVNFYAVRPEITQIG